MGKIYREGFCLLLPTTQRRIAGVIYRVFNELAAPLERDSLTYSEFVRLLTEHYDEIPWSFVRGIAAGFLPASALKDFRPDFSLINTEEKLEAALLSAPEPTPEKLERALKAINGALPYLRGYLIAHAKKLPHARGGAPRKLGTTQEQKQIREEIKDLRGPETKLGDIYARIARRYGVSASKIKQIWLDRPK